MNISKRSNTVATPLRHISSWKSWLQIIFGRFPAFLNRKQQTLVNLKPCPLPRMFSRTTAATSAKRSAIPWASRFSAARGTTALGFGLRSGCFLPTKGARKFHLEKQSSHHFYMSHNISSKTFSKNPKSPHIIHYKIQPPKKPGNSEPVQ